MMGFLTGSIDESDSSYLGSGHSLVETQISSSNEDRCGNARFACSIVISISDGPVALPARIIKPISLSNVIYHPVLYIYQNYKVHGPELLTKMSDYDTRAGPPHLNRDNL